MPTKTKTKGTAVCWRSFAGNDHAVARGMTFPADHTIPQRYPAHFCDASLPESEWPKEEVVAPPERLTGRFKVRIRKGPEERYGEPKAYVGTRPLYEGDTIEVDAKDAEHLVDVGVAEIIETLPKRLAKAGQAIATGKEVE